MITYDASISMADIHQSDNNLLADSKAPAVHRFIGDESMGTHFLSTFEIQQKILPFEGGKLSLRFYEKATISLESNGGFFRVDGWGMRLPMGDFWQLYRHMERTFMQLRSKAELGILSDKEKEQFLEINNLVDVKQFEIDWAPPHYYEGTLIWRREDQVRIEWADGKGETCEKPFVSAFGSLNPGEKFSAYIKLGKENKVMSIERVSPLYHLIDDNQQ